ncbi:MAG TPA: PQQ-dependent sugar dehydrogenase [Acidimicrobiales bacterium]|nr:PQQ-dependent sugar dehydrogenase [Acidimicrobiales bacterium]
MRCVRPFLLASAVALVAATAPPTPPGHADTGGARFFGSTGGIRLNSPVIGMARTPTGDGYWLTAADGGVFAFGNARFHGSMGGTRLNAPIVGTAAHPSGAGYWLVASDGGVFAFGNARFHGSMGGTRLNAPIVGMAAHPGGAGYWLVASDGGVFAFGNARFHGSVGGTRLNAPIVGMAAHPSGAGYWLAASDGGAFSFGASRFHGSMGGTSLNRPVVGTAGTPTGSGYWLVASDGGIFSFGDAVFHGSTGGTPLNRPVVGMAATPTGGGYWLVASDGGVFAFPSSAPTLSVSVVASGLVIPWDVAFTPDGVLLFTERPGRIGAIVGGNRRLLAQPGDVYVNSEGGLLGMAVDPEFASNRRIYVCQSWTDGTNRDVRLYAYTVDTGYTAAIRAGGPLFSGAPAGSGRHNGCRPRFGPDGRLWVGTGDAAVGTVPQDLGSLGGKVLRIDKHTGARVPGNIGGSRIHTYGHRNVQGIAVRPGSDQVYAVEHGPVGDDEITLLRAGGNSGWHPVPGYNETVPMTDTARFPDAMRPSWSSGDERLAPSGAAFVTGSNWRSWSGALAVALLRGQQLRMLFLDAEGGLLGQEVVHRGTDRLRTAVLGPDGSLYVTTSNGSNDRILRFTPS